jgi:predicted NAD/FAD-binding protein
MNTQRESVAVVGAGVSGLTAAYLLQRRYDVTLFEADDRLGGHAHTHEVVSPTGHALAIDSGFIVYNEDTYPTLVRLFAELGVATQPTDMGMSVRCDGCGLEYASGRQLAGLTADRSIARRPRYWLMLAEIIRFYRHARRVLAHPAGAEMTLGEFLKGGGYSDYFTSHFMLPMVSAVWSTGPVVAMHYPASYLFTFLDNHGMLSLNGAMPWRTVAGGCRSYVERAVKELTAVQTSTPVRSVTRSGYGVEVRDDADRRHNFDRMVMATHADTTLTLLTDPTPLERKVLGAFRYSENEAVLHRDDSLLPRRQAARVSWNYLMPSCQADQEQVVVSYDANRLQRLHSADPYLVTLNGAARIDPELVVARMTYQHPIYTTTSVAAQSGLAALNRDRTAYAGSYHGWGFHEDGCRSGAAAAASFGVQW